MILLALCVTSCTQKPVKKTKPVYKPCATLSEKHYAFIGAWEGIYKTSDGRHRRWIQNRFCDGTYSLQLYEFEDGYLVDFGQEVGRWWLKDTYFFEQGHSWPLSEVHRYSYDISHPKKIVFTRQDGYQFSDKKINSPERPNLLPIPEPIDNHEQSI